MTNPFLALGVDENASQVEIDDAFRYLSKHLNPSNFSSGSEAEEQAQRCMSRVVPAYQTLRVAETREAARVQVLESKGKPFNADEFKPFLGHICVAAGIITLDDLTEAISRQADIDLPLGQILQEKALLSQTELEGLLMGQRLFGSPNRPPDPITQRLLELTAVSKDMIKIALIDQRTNFVHTLPDLLVKRNWLSDKILKILTDQGAKQTSGAV